MLKIIIIASISGMIFPAIGHSISRRLKNNWIRFGISMIFLALSVLITYFLAINFSWCN